MQTLALENKINNGNLISVNNDRGQNIGIAKIEAGINDNVVMMEEGLWQKTNEAVYYLTSDESSDMGHGSIFYDCAVVVKKLK